MDLGMRCREDAAWLSQGRNKFIPSVILYESYYTTLPDTVQSSGDGRSFEEAFRAVRHYRFVGRKLKCGRCPPNKWIGKDIGMPSGPVRGKSSCIWFLPDLCFHNMNACEYCPVERVVIYCT